MARFSRQTSRALYVFFFLVLVAAFSYFTSNDNPVFDIISQTDRKRILVKSDAIEFASFQSSQVRILSRKNEGKLDVILTIDSEDIEDLIQEHKSEGVTSSPFPIEPDLILGNPDICKDSPDLDWIVYVHTSCSNFERGDLLRKTWANPKLFKHMSFKIIFLMGRTNSDIQMDLKKEFDKYGDIVQGDFLDDYKNLTLKGIMGLKWISQYCPHVPYALKTDDDTFLNIFEMIPLMKEHRGKSSVLICPLYSNNSMPILRDRKTCMKWCVKRSEFPGLRFFPQYCAGIAYILSRQLVTQLYDASKVTPFFWIDDVYITGLLPSKVPDPIEFVDLNSRMTLREDLALEAYEKRDQPVTYDVIHVHERLNYVALWNALLDRLTEEQKKLLQQDVSSYKM